MLHDQSGTGWATTLALTPGQGASLVAGVLLAVVVFFFWAPQLVRFLLWLWRLPFRAPFLGVWLLALGFLYFGAPIVYGDAADHMQKVITFYLVFAGAAFALSLARDPLAGMTFGSFLTIFVLAALLGAVVFLFIGPLSPEPAPFTPANVAQIMTHATVVAVVEELIFRFLFPWLFRVFGPWVAQGISALGFGFMHLAAYTQGLQHPSVAAIAIPIAFAAGLGFFFGALNVWFPEKGRGLVAGMGIHFAWNAYVLGFIGAV